MKNIYKYINITLVSILLLISYSCEKLDNYKPLYSLPVDEAITGEHSANLALIGIYSAFHQKSSGTATSPVMFIIPEFMNGFAQGSPYNASDPDIKGLIINDPLETGSTTAGIYSGLYDLVNRTNWFIEAVNKLSDSDFDTPGKKKEMIAEAKIIRALGDFYLLRLYGQFYDLNSKYGIDIRTKPAKDNKAHTRSSVADTYKAILNDLDAGIADGPDFKGHNFVSKTFAKALKARVLLYMGDYAKAAATAKDVIQNADAHYALVSDYAGIFADHNSPQIFNSPAVLFGTSGGPDHGSGIGNFYSGFYASISQKYIDIASGSMVVNGQTIKYDDTRIPAVMKPNTSYGGYYTTKYHNSSVSSGSYEMIYHMRMSEVYLILAEASARAAHSVTTEALDALNTIRLRAGATTASSGFVTYPATISFNQFLKAVRMEKIVELGAEEGETWYDLIRYDYADGFGTGFQVADVQPTATNPDKFILPIPLKSIDASNGKIEQNPSY